MDIVNNVATANRNGLGVRAGEAVLGHRVRKPEDNYVVGGLGVLVLMLLSSKYHQRAVERHQGNNGVVERELKELEATEAMRDRCTLATRHDVSPTLDSRLLLGTSPMNITSPACLCK